MAERPVSVRNNRRPIALHPPSSSIPEIIQFKVLGFLFLNRCEEEFILG
jgi:hypothetical protein